MLLVSCQYDNYKGRPPRVFFFLLTLNPFWPFSDLSLKLHFTSVFYQEYETIKMLA